MKILFQYDPCFGEYGHADPDALVSALFYAVDQGAKPDVIAWETHRFLPSECECNDLTVYRSFKERGIDMMARLIDETHRRGIKAYWHHRFSEVDLFQNTDRRVNPIKEAHPDWTVGSWRPEGNMWNLAAEGLRDFKVGYITQMAGQYAFDGLTVDFLRHLPCLPVGAQWEMRDCVTDFLRRLCKGIPHGMKLGVKIPENPAACHADGFDVEAWLAEDLVQYLVVGSRSISADVASFRRMAAGTDTEIYPCWDTWHSSDACHWQDDDFYRGVFAEWIAEGADGIVGFNYLSAPDEIIRPLVPAGTKPWGTREFSDFTRQVAGALGGILPMTFAVERRGGYPYGEGAGGTNCFAPLPLSLMPGISAEIPLSICRTEAGVLQLVLSGANPSLPLEISLNGTPLAVITRDPAYIDRQIFWPAPQQPSGAGYCYTDHPTPLLKITAQVGAGLLKPGKNRITVRADGAANIERAFLTVT